MKTALIIGGGFAGCAMAHQLELMGGWDVTLVEKAPFLGAGVRTQFWGGHPYTFGPRHFLTQMEPIFTYLNSYLPMRRCNHEFITYVERDGDFYHYPIHKDDIPRMPDCDLIQGELASVKGAAEAKNLEEYWIGSVGQSLYTKFVENYSKKMWQVDSNTRIDDFGWSPKGVALKEGPRAAWDIAISAFPEAADGYNSYFDLATAGAKVMLGTAVENYDIPAKTVTINGEKRRFDVIINTISPDELFGECYGQLPFIGRHFHKIVLPMERCFPENVYFIYYAGGEQFTRIVEYKQFYRHNSASTLLGLEIPALNAGKHYPLPFKSEMARAQRYIDLMPDGVFSIGRAGSYRYAVDIDDCIDQAFKTAEALKS